MPILSQLLKAETAEREVRSVAYQIKAARFPVYKDLSGFNFASSEVNEALVRQLHRCEFIENADNIVLVGGPGTGKSHIATALGVQAVEHNRKKVEWLEFSPRERFERGVQPLRCELVDSAAYSWGTGTAPRSLSEAKPRQRSKARA